MTPDQRDQYLRGIAASAPEKTVAAIDRQAILQAAFNAVANPQDWRAPINALVRIDEFDPIGLDVYIKAIVHFTATTPEVYVKEGFDKQKGYAIYRLVSEGYRLGPAGA